MQSALKLTATLLPGMRVEFTVPERTKGEGYNNDCTDALRDIYANRTASSGDVHAEWNIKRHCHDLTALETLTEWFAQYVNSVA